MSKTSFYLSTMIGIGDVRAMSPFILTFLYCSYKCYLDVKAQRAKSIAG